MDSPCIIPVKMKQFSIPFQLLVITLIISACGREAVPTPAPADLQGTVAAAASTGIAETQAAIPSATPSPTVTVTNTAWSTNTISPLPSEGITATPNPGAADACINQVLPASLTGDKIKIRIDNPTKGTINVSVYLQQSATNSVCGYRAYVLAPQNSLVINGLVEGCYTFWAWNPEPKDYFMVTNGTTCLDSSKGWTFDILPGSIRLRE